MDKVALNRIYLKKAGYGFVAAEQVVPFGTIIGICCLLYLFVIPDFIIVGLIGFWLFVSWISLTGSQPHLFIDQLVPLPGEEWVVGYLAPVSLLKMNGKKKAKERIGRVKARDSQGRIDAFAAFENYLDLVAIVDFQVEEYNVGAYLLNKNDRWQLVFGFEYVPFHSTLLEEEGDRSFAILQEALKDVFPGESLRWSMGCYRDDGETQAKLHDFGAGCSLPVIRLFLKSQQSKIAQLTTSGQRKVWKTYVFATYTLDGKNYGSKPGFWPKTINYFIGLFNALKGEDYRRDYERFLLELLDEGFFYGFERWKLMLLKAGLRFSPLKSDQMWCHIWDKFQATGRSPLPCPYVLEFRKQGGRATLKEVPEGGSDRHICTSLILANACPQHRSRRDAVLVKGKYCGALVLDAPHRDFASPHEALTWLWNKLSDETIYDTEVYVELTRGNLFAFQDNLDRLSNRARANMSEAARRNNDRSAKSEVDFENVQEVEKEMYSGAVPLKVAFVILVYRDSPRELEKACSFLEQAFDTSRFSRDKETGWSTYLDTLPVNLRRLLASSSFVTERRPTIPTQVAPALLPIAAPKSIDTEGIELLSFKGGKPLLVNPFGKQAESVLILGQRGSGKSFLFNQFIFHALLLGIPCTIVDVPGKHGSTYKPLVEALGDRGAYYDVVKSSLNFLEPPDLRGFSEQEIRERMDGWLKFPKSIIVEISMGGLKDPALAQRISTLASQILDIFFSDSDIIARYNAAFEGGWKSPEWQDMPVFKDFLAFATKERLNPVSFSELDEKALNQIQVEGRALLSNSSVLGRHLCRPSSCSTEPQLVVFAISGLSSEYEENLVALNVQAAAARMALSHIQSCIGYDEISVLFRSDSFSLQAGDSSATSRKSGITLIFAGQDPNAVLSSAGGPQIIQNVQYKFIGRLDPTGSIACQQLMGVDERVIQHNVSEDFGIDYLNQSTQWLLTISGRYWFVRYFANSVAVALGANNPLENLLRKQVRRSHPSGEKGNILALGEFARLLTSAYVSGTPLASLIQDSGGNNETNSFSSSSSSSLSTNSPRSR